MEYVTVGHVKEVTVEKSKLDTRDLMRRAILTAS
jgi:hypothetical protein